MTKRLVLKGCPLSTNNIYRRAKFGGMFMTAQGKALKEDWQWQIKSQWKLKPIKDTPISLSVIIYWGDKRLRDIDNGNKILLDAMNGIVYEDDKLIDEIIIRRDYDKEQPRVELFIATL